MNLGAPLNPLTHSMLPTLTATDKRKKRKAIIEASRSSNVSVEGFKRPSNDFESCRILSDSSVSSTDDLKSLHSTALSKAQSFTESKFLLRYDPAVPMTKEETSAWRKEERRKRNRESAAASRQKTRDRISELEDEVNIWKSKFDEAAQRIAKLELLYKVQKEGFGYCPAHPSTTTQGLVEESQGPFLVLSSVSPFSTPPQSPRPNATLVSPSSMNLFSTCAEGRGEERKKKNEEEHFKEIFQQAKYEILCH